jgi:hypothetical protein
MAVAKRSVSFRADIWAEVARITGEEGTQVSALVNVALAHYLHLRRGIEAARAWEAEFGAVTPEERAEADRLLDAVGATGVSSSWSG